MSSPPSVLLVDHVRRFTRLTAADAERLSGFAPLKAFKRRQTLVAAGEICSSLYFVESGLLRLASVDETGSERTLQFALEGWWLTDWDGFARSVPGAFSLQAVEASQSRVITRADYDRLFDEIPTMERYFRLVYQRGVAAATRRVHLIESQSATERYHNFVRAYPGFVDRVPGYMLASFLGFSAEFLSKIRANKV